MKCLSAFLLLFLVARCCADDPKYDREPQHPWNRLYRILYTRTMPNGSIYEEDSLEPAFTRRSTFLAEGDSHKQALALLDEFLKTNPHTLINDPLKRAMMQRDLWNVFIKTADAADPQCPTQRQRRELQRRLVQVMRRLALTPEELQRLPDNLADAAASRQFPKAYDVQRPDRPFLPDDLLRDTGPWIALCYPFGDENIAASIHTNAANGPSAFFVLLRFPGGRQAVEDYLKKLPQERMMPQIPEGTQVALLRRMMHVDNTGTLRVAPITESLQIRVYNQLKRPDMVEFTLKRKNLFSGQAGGLAPTGPNEKAYFSLLDNGDPFATGSDPPVIRAPIMKSCIECHGGPGIYGFQSMTQHRHVDVPMLAGSTIQKDVDMNISKTHKSFAWGLRQGLWETDPSR